MRPLALVFELDRICMTLVPYPYLGHALKPQPLGLPSFRHSKIALAGKEQIRKLIEEFICNKTQCHLTNK